MSKNRYLNAFASSALSIMPIIVIVIVLSITNLAPIGDTFDHFGMGWQYYALLLIGAFAMIFGLSLFSIGASKSLIKVGEYMGTSLSKQKNLWIVIIFAFLLGALITCAEPSILIVSNQVQINKWILIGSIAGGVGLFVVIGVLRIAFNRSLKLWYVLFYFIVFLFICLLEVNPVNHKFLPFIFDAGGITTGSATVPFILALGAGVAMVRGGKNSRDSSFGLVGIASIGPIITMAILIMVSPSGFSDYQVGSIVPADQLDIAGSFLDALLPKNAAHLGSIIEVVMALAPILIIFFIYESMYIKLSARKIGQLMIGFLFAFIGLTVFLTAVSAAMSPIGLLVGQKLAALDDYIVIVIAFVIGMVTILCEPAVHVLTKQIEEVSDGQLKKRTVLFTLSLGVGVAIMLSIIRTISYANGHGFSIMWYIIPGYLISIVLMFAVPDLYTAIAFDSGGTASGPMAVSFVLPLIIGLYSARAGIDSGVEFYETSFGVVALIALTPIIAIQMLGLVSKFKTIYALKVMREQLTDARNGEIIHFSN